jgi:hypothetical protein
MSSPTVWVAAATVVVLIVGSLLFVRRHRHALPGTGKGHRANVDDPVVPAIPERRQSPRRWGDPVQVLITDYYHAEHPLKGWTVNRSPGGLGLSVPEAILVGSVIKIRATLAPEAIPWIDLEVKNCNPVAGRWELNCMYVGPPAEEIRRLFH